ncbi:MAG TPA: DHA2 family efflux MFS transporter permease subunit [Streptosporangiaceae bacterium]|jgi:EmrB/QacA subfamily drug resistance transporter
MTQASTQPPAAAAGAASTSGLTREILVLSAVIILGTIMTVLDLTVVNVAIPTLGSDLGTSISSIQWVLTGYMLAFATVIPVTGWAAERFGAKRVWLTALLLFLAGSVLAGAAWSIGSMIVFRVVQGLGAGMILPVGQTILAQAAGPQRMGRVMSIIGVPMLLAPVFGPVLGGAIVGAASWRWIFFINLPVGAAAVLAAQRLLPDSRPRPGQRLDVRGLLLLCPGIGVFLYGMSVAGDRVGFGNPRTVAAVLAGLGLIVLFFWHAARRGKSALIDISLFGRRGFASAAAVNLLLGVALFGSLILIPLYYQLVRGNGPFQIGLLLGPQGIGAALALPFAGKLTDKIGARTVASAGIVIALLGTLAYTQVRAGTPDLYLAAALLVIGIGIGATIVPSMAAGFQVLSRAETPRGTSALNAIQRIAGAIGTALFAIVLQSAITANLPHHPGGSHALTALPSRAAAASALASAFDTTFWVAVALIAAALIPALLLPRRSAASQRGHQPSPAENETQGRQS